MELHFSPNAAINFVGARADVFRHEAGMKQETQPYVFKFAGMLFDTVEVHQGEAAFSSTVAEALRAMPVGTPFQRLGWLKSWQEHIGAADGYLAVMVSCLRDGRPVLLMPLCLTQHRGLRKLSWMGQNLDDYCGPVGEAGALLSLTAHDVHSIFKQVGAALGGTDVVYLQKQKAWYGEVSNPFVTAASIPYHAASHRTLLQVSWDDYLAGKRSAKSRSRLRNKLAALSKAGKLDIRFAHDADEAARLVSTGLAMKAAQLAERGHHNPFATEEARRHLVNVFSHQCPESSWAVALFLDGTPLAISFGFKDDRSWLLYQIAMQSSAHDNLSPGAHLIMFIMKHCCELKVSEFDFSLGDEAYKLEWCETSERLYSSYIPLTLRGHFAAMASRLSAHSRNVVASNERLYEFGKTAKLKLNQLFGDKQRTRQGS